MGKCHKLHKTFADSITCPDCVKVVCEMQLGELTQEFLKLKAALEPIREVWESYKRYMDKYNSMQNHDRLPILVSYEFWRAIQESVKRMEGGE